MISEIHLFNFLMPILYLSTLSIYIYDFVKGGKRISNSKRIFLFFTLSFHFLYLVLRTIQFQHFPITNVFEIFTILAFCISLSYFLLELLTDIRGTGPFIIVISFVFQLLSTMFIKDLDTVESVLRNPLLGSHVFNALCGYSGFAISAVYGFLYLTLYKDIKKNKFGLIFERLPNLEILEKLSFYSAIIGFFFLTIATIIGIIWLPQAFEKFSYTDPKIVGTFLVWLLYLIGIISKIFGKVQGRKVITYSIVGFIIALLSTFISNFFARSFHSFY